MRLDTTLGSRLLAALACCLVACGGGAPLVDEDVFGSGGQTAAQLAPYETGDLPTGASGHPLRATAVVGDWGTFRGNVERSGTRLARGISEPRILWSAEVGIQGYANTPLVTEEAVFMSSQGELHNMADSRDGFYALDRLTGEELWFYGTNEDVNGASLTGELVIGGTDDGTLYAVRRVDGTLAWELELDTPLTHGPLVVADRLYVQGSGHLTLLEASSGRGLGRVAAASDGWEPRGGLAAHGERVFRTSPGGNVEAFDDGDRLWLVEVSPSREIEAWAWSIAYSPPAVIGGAILVAVPVVVDYQSAEVSIALLDPATGAPFWSTEAEANLGAPMMRLSSMVAYDQLFYAAVPWLMNGMLYHAQISNPYLVAFDLATGEAVRTLELPDCRCRQFSSIVGVPSRGYFARHDGILYAFTPATGVEAWAIRLGRHTEAGVLTSMSGGGQDMYGIDGYCSGAPYDSTALFSTPAIGADGTLYVGSGDGWLYAITDESWD